MSHFLLLRLQKKLLCIQTTKEDKLFRTKDGQSVLVNIITSESKGNKFYRLQAIKDANNALEDIESQNPFDN